MNDLGQGQGHLIRGQMLKISPFLGCDYMPTLNTIHPIKHVFLDVIRMYP